MEGTDRNFEDKTILTTPKPTASSTASRKSIQKKIFSANLEQLSELTDDKSVGRFSMKSFEGLQEKYSNLSQIDISYQLQQQRDLANNSIQRANKVSGLPSRYLKPNVSQSAFDYCDLSAGSTINESDLLRTPRPRDNSTPRSSIVESENLLKPRPSLGESMAQLSYKITNTNITFDNFVKEMQQVMNGDEDGGKSGSKVDSNIFVPAEEAESKLLADELSWRRQNDVPATSDNFSSQLELPSCKMSMGEFFKEKSDNISDFKGAKSPVKTRKPVALIDSSLTFSENTSQVEENNYKSLSVSTIAKFLSETDETPRKVVDYLLNHGNYDKKCDSSLAEQVSLPVSKNSSYTSNYSANEVMKCVVNKENIDTSNLPQNSKKKQTSINLGIKLSSPTPLESRSSSVASTARSSSCLTNLPNGKLPIETNKCELVWGCVKVDKCVTKEVLLRNKSSKSIRMQLTLSGQSFKIRKDNRPDSDPLNSTKIMLHAHESRAIIVSFMPTKIGAAVDELAFTSLDPHLEQTKNQYIRLYGYGGYGTMEFHHVTKDTSHRYWLSLGRLNSSNELQQSFTVVNTGTLPSFACIAFISKELCMFSNVSISCNFFVLNPQEQKEITISYIPSTEDYKKIQNISTMSIIDIGVLKLISSTEVSRGRLKRLCRKAGEKNQKIDPLSETLIQKIAGECIPSDIICFKETLGAMKDILKLFNTHEIILTVEQDPEQTLMPQYPDDSIMFQSLCNDTTAVLENTIHKDTCKIEPSNIILTPPTKVDDTIFFKSKGNRTLHYEAKSVPDGLEIHPKMGEISPYETILFQIKCPKQLKEGTIFKVLVYVENEVFEATVKIIFIHSSQLKF